MSAVYYLRVAVLLFLPLLLLSCEQRVHQVPVPISLAGLTGRWQQDSAAAIFYNPQREFGHRATYPFERKGVLVLTPTRWHYIGEAERAYTRLGNALYLQQEAVGQENGRVDTLIITTLDKHRVIFRDSITEASGGFRVWYDYYSR